MRRSLLIISTVASIFSIFSEAAAQQPGSGYCLNFNGGSYVDCGSRPDSLFDFATNGTIEAWVEITSTPPPVGSNTCFSILGKDDGAGSFNKWFFGVQDGELAFHINNTQGNPQWVYSNPFTLQLNKFYHFAVTKDTNHLVTFYVDGIKMGGATLPDATTIVGSDMVIGNSEPCCSMYGGEIDEVRFWKKILTQQEIRDWMCRKVTASHPEYASLAAYFKFDEGSGNSTTDNSGIIGTLVANPQWVTSGASIGDSAVHDYINPVKTATIGNSYGENFSATLTNGNPDCIVTYRVDQPPNTYTGINTSWQSDKYFGVFQSNLDGSVSQYTTIYSYNGNPYVNAGSICGISLYKRTNNADIPWVIINAPPNLANQTITVTGESTEYILAGITICLPTIQAGIASGNISACAGSASASPLIQQFYVSGFNLTANITGTAPAGFEVSLTAGSGYSNSITIPKTGGTIDSVLVYVRSAASDPSGNISGNVVLSSPGTTTQSVAVKGVVNALLTVNSVPNQIVSNGSPTAAVNFTGTGNTFNWVNNMTSIGLAASDTGNIASFTAINTGSIPVIATVTVTPISAEFAYVANASISTVSVINTTTNTVVANIPVGPYPSGVSVSPDGSRVYVTNHFSLGTVSVINTVNNMVIATIPVGSSPLGVSVSPDGSRVYVANNTDGTVSVINTASNAVIAAIGVGSGPLGVSFSPNGSRAYIANEGSNNVSVISTATNSVVATIPVGLDPYGVSVTPDGKWVYVTNQNSNTVSVINTATNTVIASIGVGTFPDGISVNPDGSLVYVTNYDDGTVSVINTTTNVVTATIPVGIQPSCVSVSSDGSRVYVPNLSSANVSVIDATTNTVVATVTVGESPSALGNFVTSGQNCGGIPVTFTITVNPSTDTIITTPATGSISACAGTASVSPLIQEFYVSGNNLAANITATAPTDFEVSLSPGSGYGTSVSIPQTGGMVDSILVYVRSAASAPPGNISGNVVLTSAGATSQNVAVTGIVNALPTVTAVPNQIVLNGSPTAAVNFTGTGNTFNWVNNTPSIGLAASGTGNISSFTAINTGSTPITATITVSPVQSGYAYITTGSGPVYVISTGTNSVVSIIPNVTTNNEFGVSLNPNGSLLYFTNGPFNTVTVINTATDLVVASIPVGTGPAGIMVSPDGSLIYVANSGSNTVSVINASTNAVIANILVGGGATGLAVSPDGSEVYVTNNGPNTVSVINTSSNTMIATIPVGPNPIGVCFSPHGNFAYVANQGIAQGTVSVINVTTNIVVATIPVGTNPYGVLVSPDGSQVYVTNTGSNTVSVINTSTNTVVATIPVGTFPFGISVTSDGRFAYVANQLSNNVSVINTATNTVVTTIPVPGYPTSLGNFITSGIGCTGTPTTFTITVNPSTDTIITTPPTGSISSCAGTASLTPLIQQFYISGNNLTANITATAPTGFEVSLTPVGGYGLSVSIPQSGGTVDSILVYIRSAASAPTGNISGNVVLSSPGAASQNVAATGIVNALPTVNAVPNQVVLNGNPTTAVNFTGTGNVFNWVNNAPSIGLAANGTGDIASFTAINTGNAPVIATITAIPLSPGFAYVSGTSNNVSVINTATNAVVSSIPIGTSGSFGISASPDGSRVYVTSSNNNNTSYTLSVINTITNTVVAIIPVGSGAIAVAASPDGSKVYVTNQNLGNISVINSGTNTIVSTIPCGQYPGGIVVSPDGSKLFISSTGSNTVTVVSTATNSILATITIGSSGAPYGAGGISASPNGNWVYATNYSSNSVSVINTTTNTVIATIPVGTNPYEVSVSPDGSKVYVTNSGSNTVSVINTATNSVIATIPVGANPLGISITSDGSKVYVVNDYSSSVSVISTATNTVIATPTVGGGPISFGNFITSGTGCTGLSTTFTITVNPLTDTIKTTAATGNISACVGIASVSPNIEQFYVSGNNLTGNIIATAPPEFEVSLAPGSGYADSVSVPQTGGKADSILVYVRSAASAPSGNISGNVVLSSSGATSQNVAVSGIIQADITPSVSIVASATTICPGSSVTFTATPTNGGSAPSYQWQLNSNNVGTNSPTFTSTTIVNGEVISCKMTSNAPCATGIAASNTITTIVIPSVGPSISIAASTNNICAGTPVIFTATPTNGGTTPIYQWRLNGAYVGTNSTTFTSATLLNGDVVKCTITSNATCATPISASSNVIIIIISPPVTPAISISASSTSICSGTTVTFTAASINGGSTPLFQWMINGNIVGTNGATYSSGSLANGDVISCAMTSNAPCATGSAASNIITMNVTAPVTPSVSITASANAVCEGTAVTFTAVPDNGGNPSYQWLVNGDDAGNNSNAFTSSNINNGDNISCVMTSSLPCTSPVASSTLSMVIYPLPTVTFIPDTVYTTSSGYVQLNPIITGTVEKYLWLPATGLNSPDIENPDASVVNTVIYQLQVTSDHGCSATGNITVLPGLPLQMPNAFTPNGDGHNDVFRIPPGVQFSLQEFDIFNSWGNRVFTTNDITKGWDGTYKGLPAEAGVYVYMIRGKNAAGEAAFLKGIVVLIR